MIFSDKVKPIFILGVPRSGTTLVQSLLDGHPQLLTDVGESGFFSRYLKKTRWVVSQRKRLNIAERYLLRYFSKKDPYYKNFLSHISHEKIRSNFKRLFPPSKYEQKLVLEAYLFAIGLSSNHFTENIKYWVEKTPYNEYYMRKINKWWPMARYLHVIRDPRSIYNSIRIRAEKNNREMPSIESISFEWAKSVDIYFKYYERFKERYLMIKYEDITQNIEAELSKIIKIFSIRDQKILRQPTKGLGKVPWGGNAASEKKIFSIHKELLGKWKNDLKEIEIEGIEAILKERMYALGYDSINSGNTKIKKSIDKPIKNFLREIKFKVQHF